MVVVSNIANTIIKKSIKDNKLITPLKLNYLIYLLYKEYLFKYGVTLFSERFVITEYGPFLPTIQCKFGCYGNDFIRTFARNANKEVSIVKGEQFDVCLNYIWEKYKNYNEVSLFNIISKDVDLNSNEKYIFEEINNNKLFLKAKELHKKM